MPDKIHEIMERNKDVPANCSQPPCAAPNMCRLAGVCGASLPEPEPAQRLITDSLKNCYVQPPSTDTYTTKGRVDNTKRRDRAGQRMLRHAMWYLCTVYGPVEAICLLGSLYRGDGVVTYVTTTNSSTSCAA